MKERTRSPNFIGELSHPRDNRGGGANRRVASALARDITPEAIESFLNSLHQVEWVPVEGSAKYDPKAKRTKIAKRQVETDAPLSASSKNQYRTILSSIFSFNIKRGRYDVNPATAVREEKEPGRDSLMMPDEFRQFRAKCHELGDYELDCFSVLATTTALRRLESAECLSTRRLKTSSRSCWS